MFIKIIIILLLLIVAASLLTGRGLPGPRTATPRPPSRLRPLMLRVAVTLLALGAALVTLHFWN